MSNENMSIDELVDKLQKFKEQGYEYVIGCWQYPWISPRVELVVNIKGDFPKTVGIR